MNKCLQGPHRAVHSAQGPGNSILCTGEILTGHPGGLNFILREGEQGFWLFDLASLVMYSTASAHRRELRQNPCTGLLHPFHILNEYNWHNFIGKRFLSCCDLYTCMPRRAKMKMNRKRRSRSERMEEMAFISATTRFLRLDQYLCITEPHGFFPSQNLMVFFTQKDDLCFLQFFPMLKFWSLCVDSMFTESPYT